ncbi:hypothetical protein Arth_1355 [Arthrobacter sp. FB24]|uniref:hypothetical protein n=1 Tax=Arthrobacter sp. (strain FB24) TaxID=290399 RepID=UPI0000527BD3|nr:hypothetical protein [Arthrobacter sp. FB24]ABK02749.1 hypothetical protein Arth_1355 [Arthrobacter sp. FB24]
MANLQEAFQAAAARLAEDIRKIDAGELDATPAHRAFLDGAVKAWTQPAVTESGGYSVDRAVEAGAEIPQSPSQQGPAQHDPENPDLADTNSMDFDGAKFPK